MNKMRKHNHTGNYLPKTGSDGRSVDSHLKDKDKQPVEKDIAQSSGRHTGQSQFRVSVIPHKRC